jgi:hypothetical protein
MKVNMADTQKDKPFKPLRVGKLADINQVVAMERRIIRAMARGGIGLADGERLCRALKELRLSLSQRDLESEVKKATALLEEVRALKGKQWD